MLMDKMWVPVHEPSSLWLRGGVGWTGGRIWWEV